MAAIHKVREVSSSFDEPVTILLLGSDTRGSNPLSDRTDAIILAKVNPKTGRAMLISFPRDSYVSIPGVRTDKINAAITVGGPERIVATVESISGIKVDYYAITTFESFKRLIRAVGKVPVNVDMPVHDNLVGVDLNPGPQLLTPHLALDFSRARHLGEGDFTRAKHQQDVLIGALKVVRKDRTPARLIKLIAAFLTNTASDLSAIDLAKLSHAIYSLDPSKVDRMVLPGSTGMAGSASVVYLDQSAASRAFSRMSGL